MIIKEDCTEGLPEYYDNAFKGGYPNLHYICSWILDSIMSNRGVYIHPYLDIGCGMGRLSMIALYKYGLTIEGVDFSEYGIKVAKEINDNTNFYLEDIWKFSNYNNYKTFIISDVLEHLSKDVDFLRMLPKDRFVIVSVPTPCLGDTYHLRMFETAKDVVDRYSQVLEIQEMKLIGNVSWGFIGKTI